MDLGVGRQHADFFEIAEGLVFGFRFFFAVDLPVFVFERFFRLRLAGNFFLEDLVLENFLLKDFFFAVVSMRFFGVEEILVRVEIEI